MCHYRKTTKFQVIDMVSHDFRPDADSPNIPERRQRVLRRLDDGHAALLEALADLGETEAFLGSRWSVWEVMQHLLTEDFVDALEQIATGERDMLPAFDGRANRIANDIARLEANYQRFRRLLSGLTEEQLSRPATPPNPENNFPALSFLDLVERVSGHEGNHARQVVETRKYVAAFRSMERAVTVAGLGTGDPDAIPDQTRQMLANADYVVGSEPAISLARRWSRGVELPMRADNANELVNRIGRDTRAGLWTMVVTLGDPAESVPGLLRRLQEEVDAVSLIPAPGFYRLVLAQLSISPLAAVCTSVNQMGDGNLPDPAAGRAVVILGTDEGGAWSEVCEKLLARGVAEDAKVSMLTNLMGRPEVVTGSLCDLAKSTMTSSPAAVDSAMVLY
jgi:precorrin-6B methylase 1